MEKARRHRVLRQRGVGIGKEVMEQARRHRGKEARSFEAKMQFGRNKFISTNALNINSMLQHGVKKTVLKALAMNKFCRNTFKQSNCINGFEFIKVVLIA